MNDDASGAPMGTPAPAAPFGLRRVPPATAAERLTREEGMARALRFGATPYRDAEDKGRYVLFKEANLAPVEPWVRDPRNKRRYRRVQEVRKAAGQLVGQPGDRIEIAKRLGVLHWEDGSDIEGAAARGLYDAIWSREHVYDSFTVPRRYGRSLMETGRVAAVAEEEARKLQAEDPKASGGFWVRMRNDLGLVYVVPNVDPEAEGEEEEHPAPPILAAAGADDEVVSGPVEQDIFVGSEPRDPSDVPLLRDEGDIVTFIVERQSLDGGVFRQEAFEAGLDPDRAEFFRDLLRGTAEDREALLQRAGSLFTQWELWNSVQGAIPTVLATDDPEARKSIVRGAARYARPHDEKRRANSQPSRACNGVEGVSAGGEGSNTASSCRRRSAGSRGTGSWRRPSAAAFPRWAPPSIACRINLWQNGCSATAGRSASRPAGNSEPSPTCSTAPSASWTPTRVSPCAAAPSTG